MENHFTVFRIDVSKQTGEVMLFIETDCGFKPMLGWPNVTCMQDFADRLLGICYESNDARRKAKDENAK